MAMPPTFSIHALPHSTLSWSCPFNYLSTLLYSVILIYHGHAPYIIYPRPLHTAVSHDSHTIHERPSHNQGHPLTQPTHALTHITPPPTYPIFSSTSVISHIHAYQCHTKLAKHTNIPGKGNQTSSITCTNSQRQYSPYLTFPRTIYTI